jgi:hypothetical protein
MKISWALLAKFSEQKKDIKPKLKGNMEHMLYVK